MTKIFNLGILICALWGVKTFILLPMNIKVGITSEGLITAIICSAIALIITFMYVK